MYDVSDPPGAARKSLPPDDDDVCPQGGDFPPPVLSPSPGAPRAKTRNLSKINFLISFLFILWRGRALLLLFVFSHFHLFTLLQGVGM